MANPIEIRDGDLLEYSKTEEIIEAAEWNAVMNTIKSAINSHAAAIQSLDDYTHTGTIYSSAGLKDPCWSRDNNDPNLFAVTITQKEHGIKSKLAVHLFNSEGIQVYTKV